VQNVSCTHLNPSLLLPLFITCLAACEQQSIRRDRVTLANVGRGFILLVQRNGVVIVVRWVMGALIQRCRNPLPSFPYRDGPTFWLGGVCDMVGRSTPTCMRWRSYHQMRKRRSSRHRRRKPQSTSSVNCNPSGLSVSRRRAVDDKEGHLIYNNGDILHSRCTQAFVYLLIRKLCLSQFNPVICTFTVTICSKTVTWCKVTPWDKNPYSPSVIILAVFL